VPNLKMETACFSETLVPLCQTTLLNFILEEVDCSKNLIPFYNITRCLILEQIHINT
jgi:hypothetical protein